MEYSGIIDYGLFSIKRKEVHNSYKLELNDELKIPNGGIIKIVDGIVQINGRIFVKGE